MHRTKDRDKKVDVRVDSRVYIFRDMLLGVGGRQRHDVADNDHDVPFMYGNNYNGGFWVTQTYAAVCFSPCQLDHSRCLHSNVDDTILYLLR